MVELNLLGRSNAGVRVAIQGEAGSNSHAAVEALLGEQQIVPCERSESVFTALSDMRADVAVLPIENSLHGSVIDHYDLLLTKDVHVVGECELRIHHSLIAPPGTSLADVRRVLSHPVALSQCRRFFAANPGVEAVSFYDTAGSVKHVMETRPARTAAIARDTAAAIYGGDILQRGLEDDPQNFTRFFLLSRDATAVVPGEANKMSLAFAIEHRPGSLVASLQRLADLGADLTRIESRPVPGRPWEYVFYVDLRLAQGSADDVVAALRKHCSMVKELGRYAAAVSVRE